MQKNKPVWVYRNLKHGRKAKPLYSVMQNGKVVDRVHRILLTDVRFVVREGGRQRVLREGRKNVHAFAVGKIQASAMGTDSKGRLPVNIGYSPHKGNRFFCSIGSGPLLTPISGADCVILNEYGMSGAYIN